jgi:glycosyltransferase involved in cell wall biosynthesis
VIDVLYDISVLGIGHYFIRAGVVRVVENFLDGLILNNECSVRGFVPASFHLHPALDAIEQRYHGKFFIAVPPRHRSLYCRMREQLLEESLSRSSAAGKLNKWLLFYLSAALESNVLSRTRATVPVADIYHSPFRPLPDNSGGRSGAKRFLTVHDLIPIRFPQYYSAGSKFFNIVRRAIQSLRPDDWALCNSDSTRNDLCEYRRDLDPERVVVTHLAASASFYPCREPDQLVDVRKKYRIPEGHYFLSLGTLEPRKNLPHLIRSFAALVLQERLNDLSLVLVGEKGWQYDAIFKEIAAAGIANDRIVFTGFVPDEDLSALYSGALAFVYLSLYEGFGLPPLEAMQCGVPVITSNTSSLPEVVGKAGIMLAPGDGDALGQAMLKLYRDDVLRQCLAGKSLARASMFSWERCVGETVATYRKAML